MDILITISTCTSQYIENIYIYTVIDNIKINRKILHSVIWHENDLIFLACTKGWLVVC